MPSPLRKKRVCRKKQQISDLTKGSSAKSMANTRKKSPVKPVTKIHSKFPGLKKKISPTKLKHTHTRIYATDNKYSYKKPRLGPYEGTYKCYGLTPKEKMQIIGNCQSRSIRYMQLKKQAADAIKNNKIFTVYGPCKAVREALVERGWVEKFPSQRMNMKSIYNGHTPQNEIRGQLEILLLSNFVEKCPPNFIWRTKDHHGHKDSAIDMTKDYAPIVNKLEIDTAWTTKQGLCSTIERNHWFYIEGVAEVYCPRTYNISCDPSEVESFKDDYRVTACTSLLKWVLSMIANNRPVFVPDGTVSIKVILFAVNRCKEYLYRKQNKDIDRTMNSVSPGQWKTFMKNYWLIISKAECFKSDKSDLLNLYLSYAKFILKEIYKYRPQLSCEGCHNIWIVKPAHCCRGRGIKLVSRLEEVTDMLEKTKAKYVMQKYIEEPLLVHKTKFDIRQYYLITSTCPLIIWMYKDCYLKFSTQKYNLKNYHESIHLTNNAVQKKYTPCDDRHKELPRSNMWDSDTFKSYLNKIGKEDVWDKVVYPGMKKAIRSIVMGCQDSLNVCKNRFELYGCDFLLDKEYKPWLIEINSCPDLQHTTPVTAKICPAVVNDIIKVVIDYAKDPNSPTGKFECIYRQPDIKQRYTVCELLVRGYSLPSSYFYKGKYELKDPLNDLKLNQLDIMAIMKTMKKIYYNETGLDCEDSNELLGGAELDSQLSIAEIDSTSFTADNLSSKVQKAVSNPNIHESKESDQSGSCSTIIDSDASKSSTKSLKIISEKKSEHKIISEKKSEHSVVADSTGSDKDKDWVDLRPLENTLLDLLTSTKRLDPLETNLTPVKNTGQATSNALVNMLVFLRKKEKEEREYIRNYNIDLKKG